jgi:hypothetical protein
MKTAMGRVMAFASVCPWPKNKWTASIVQPGAWQATSLPAYSAYRHAGRANFLFFAGRIGVPSTIESGRRLSLVTRGAKGVRSMFSVKSLANGYADKPKNGPDPDFAILPALARARHDSSSG